MDSVAEGEATSTAERIRFVKGSRPGEVRVTYAFQCPENVNLFDSDSDEVGNPHPCIREPFVTKEIFGFNKKVDMLWIKPLTTFESPDFLNPRYGRLETIALEGFDFHYPRTADDVPDFLLGLPSGFVRTIEGLGFKATLKPLITQLNTYCSAKSLTISRKRATAIHAEEVVISSALFDSIRKSINRTHNNALVLAGRDKGILVYNALFHELDPERFPKRLRPYSPDTIFKAVAGANSGLSRKDQAAALEVVRQNKKSLRIAEPEALMDLHREIELVTLQELIERMEKLIAKSVSEETWQKLFVANPFILHLAFNIPLMIIGQQFSVGGTTFKRNGDTIVDFLAKSEFTNNVTIIEIKTPTSKLRGKVYRQGLFAPQSDLAGSVTQILDQKYEMHKNLAQLSYDSRKYDLEAYAIRCLVIIGIIPSDPIEQKSFELFRSNIHGVQIVTFDELLTKLRQLQEYLSPEHTAEKSTSL